MDLNNPKKNNPEPEIFRGGPRHRLEAYSNPLDCSFTNCSSRSGGIIIPRSLIEVREELKRIKSELEQIRVAPGRAEKLYMDLGVIRRFSSVFIKWTKKGKETVGLYEEWMLSLKAYSLKSQAVMKAENRVQELVNAHISTTFPKLGILETYLDELSQGISGREGIRYYGSIATKLGKEKNSSTELPVRTYEATSTTNDDHETRRIYNQNVSNEAGAIISSEVEKLLAESNGDYKNWKNTRFEAQRRMISELNQITASINPERGGVDRLISNLCRKSLSVIRKLDFSDSGSLENWKAQRDALRSAISSFKGRVLE